MPEVKINLEIKDLEPVKDLLQVLEENYNDLPLSVQGKIKEICGKAGRELTGIDFENSLDGNYGEFSHSLDESIKVKTINLELKRITTLHDKYLFPETYWVKKNGIIVWEW